MPALSPTMTQGNIVQWAKAVGDSVAPGDVLCEVETDKATIAWESQEEGYVAAILLGNGSKDVAVGSPAAVLVEDEVGGHGWVQRMRRVWPAGWFMHVVRL